MVLEHLFPPIPSEVIMPFAGFLSSRQPETSLGLVILAMSLGSLMGTLVWRVLGRLVSLRQILARTNLSSQLKDIQKALTVFQQGSGHWVVGGWYRGLEPQMGTSWSGGLVPNLGGSPLPSSPQAIHRPSPPDHRRRK